MYENGHQSVHDHDPQATKWIYRHFNADRLGLFLEAELLAKMRMVQVHKHPKGKRYLKALQSHQYALVQWRAVADEALMEPGLCQKIADLEWTTQQHRADLTLKQKLLDEKAVLLSKQTKEFEHQTSVLQARRNGLKSLQSEPSAVLCAQATLWNKAHETVNLKIENASVALEKGFKELSSKLEVLMSFKELSSKLAVLRSQKKRVVDAKAKVQKLQQQHQATTLGRYRTRQYRVTERDHMAITFRKFMVELQTEERVPLGLCLELEFDEPRVRVNITNRATTSRLKEPGYKTRGMETLSTGESAFVLSALVASFWNLIILPPIVCIDSCAATNTLLKRLDDCDSIQTLVASSEMESSSASDTDTYHRIEGPAPTQR